MDTSPRLRLTVFALAGVALLLYGGVWLVSRITPPDVQKRVAAQTTYNAELAIQAAHRRPAATSNATRDPLQAAVLGPHTSPITTDAGSLPSKITATNPNFAAA